MQAQGRMQAQAQMQAQGRISMGRGALVASPGILRVWEDRVRL